MKWIALVAGGLIVGVLAVCELASRAADAAAEPAETGRVPGLEVPGRTRCLLGRRGIIASPILRPVVEVLVSAGDRVTRGQPLIKLYDLEPQAKVRARENDFKSIESKAKLTRRNLDLAERSRSTGALPETSYNEIRATALSNESQAKAAEAELALAQGELKLYTVTASIDGEIAWLDVSPGTVTWPGSLIWGEIVDVRELDVRCELTPVQAEQVAVGQSAEIWIDGKPEATGSGRIVMIGKAADRNTGFIPVVVRVANPQERLRVEVPVKVRFEAEKKAQ